MNITPITPAVSLGDYQSFVSYVSSFYEEGEGLYSEDFTPPVSRSEIAKAAIVLLEEYDEINSLRLSEMEFEGDTVDREYVRNILEEARGGERYYIREELKKKRTSSR
jgi:hypothetical protein